MTKIIVFVEGGVVQDFISDSDGVELMIVNFDDEEEQGAAGRTFMPVARNMDAFSGVLADAARAALNPCHARPTG